MCCVCEFCATKAHTIAIGRRRVRQHREEEIKQFSNKIDTITTPTSSYNIITKELGTFLLCRTCARRAYVCARPYRSVGGDFRVFPIIMCTPRTEKRSIINWNIWAEPREGEMREEKLVSTEKNDIREMKSKETHCEYLQSNTRMLPGWKICGGWPTTGTKTNTKRHNKDLIFDLWTYL